MLSPATPSMVPSCSFPQRCESRQSTPGAMSSPRFLSPSSTTLSHMPMPTPTPGLNPSPSLNGPFGSFGSFGSQGPCPPTRSVSPPCQEDLFRPSDFRPEDPFIANHRLNSFSRHRAALAHRDILTLPVQSSNLSVSEPRSTRRIQALSPSLCGIPVSPTGPVPRPSSRRSASMSMSVSAAGTLCSANSLGPNLTRGEATRASLALPGYSNMSATPPRSLRRLSSGMMDQATTGQLSLAPSSPSPSAAIPGLGLVTDAGFPTASTQATADPFLDKYDPPSTASKGSADSLKDLTGAVLPYAPDSGLHTGPADESKGSLYKMSSFGSSACMSLAHEGSWDTFTTPKEDLESGTGPRRSGPQMLSFSSDVLPSSIPDNLPADPEPRQNESQTPDAKRTRKLARMLGTESMSEVLLSQAGIQGRQKCPESVHLDPSISPVNEVPEASELPELGTPPPSCIKEPLTYIPQTASPKSPSGLPQRLPLSNVMTQSKCHASTDSVSSTTPRRPIRPRPTSSLLSTSGTSLNPVIESPTWRDGVRPKAAALLGIDPSTDPTMGPRNEVQPKAAALLGIDPSLPFAMATSSDIQDSSNRQTPSRPLAQAPGAISQSLGSRPSFWPKWHMHLHRSSSSAALSTATGGLPSNSTESHPGGALGLNTGSHMPSRQADGFSPSKHGSGNDVDRAHASHWTVTPPSDSDSANTSRAKLALPKFTSFSALSKTTRHEGFAMSRRAGRCSSSPGASDVADSWPSPEVPKATCTSSRISPVHRATVSSSMGQYTGAGRGAHSRSVSSGVRAPEFGPPICVSVDACRKEQRGCDLGSSLAVRPGRHVTAPASTLVSPGLPSQSSDLRRRSAPSASSFLRAPAQIPAGYTTGLNSDRQAQLPKAAKILGADFFSTQPYDLRPTPLPNRLQRA